MSLCGHLKRIRKNPGDNEGSALLLLVCEPLVGEKKLLCVSQQSEMLVTRVPDGRLSSLGSGLFPALVRDCQGEKRREDDGNQKDTKLMRWIQSKQREQGFHSQSLSREKQSDTSADDRALRSVSFYSLITARLVSSKRCCVVGADLPHDLSRRAESPCSDALKGGLHKMDKISFQFLPFRHKRHQETLFSTR